MVRADFPPPVGARCFNGAALTGARMGSGQKPRRQTRIRSASTGPRSRGRGWHLRMFQIHHVCFCFNGAALTGARMARCAPPASATSPGLQRGRAHGGADGGLSSIGAPQPIRLQRGRAHGGADGRLLRTSAMRLKELQRGRAHGGADGAISQSGERNQTEASTGPRSRGRGWGNLSPHKRSA